MMESLFEQNSGTYSTVGDYRLPNLTVPNEPENHIGIWGRRRLDYLKKHKRLFYINLLTAGQLTDHLCKIDTSAAERYEIIIQQVATAQCVTEQLKTENQMLWVGKMNNIRACAEEIVRNELIYG